MRETGRLRVGDALKLAAGHSVDHKSGACMVCRVREVMRNHTRLKREVAMAVLAIGEGNGERMINLLAEVFHAGWLYGPRRP